MGWAGGTGLFDGAVDLVLEFETNRLFNGEYPAHDIEYVVRRVYTGLDWSDWDTQDESKYFEPYLRQVMADLGELDEDC